MGSLTDETGAKLPTPEEVEMEAEKEALARLCDAIDYVNSAWADVQQRRYKLWVDWDARPFKIVLCEGIRIERQIIYPR